MPPIFLYKGDMMKILCVLLCLCLLLIPFYGAAESNITVGEGKDYQSFTQAIYDTVNSGKTVIVYPGIYDIKQEYKNLFGVDTVTDNMDLGNNFQYGVWITNRKVIFMPGAQLTCTWDLNSKFSPICVAKNVILDGLDLYAEGTLYAIHDDIWREYDAYINEYHHCRVIGRLLKNANCIGGGVTKHTRIIIDNCYFDNGVADSLTVRYHNTDIPDGQGDIWISNSYFNGYLGLCYYGTTTHLNVYVNGCAAEKIYTKHEISDTPIYNIDLYQWNNEVNN